MHYCIIANPASGQTSADRKRRALAGAAQILQAKIHGLDTQTSRELAQCARRLAEHCDVLVVAGGDGTFSDIINAVDTRRTAVAFLPLGTGNALRHALKYRGTAGDIARRIRNGRLHAYDLIDCDGKKRAFMVALGIEGTVIALREQYRRQGAVGFVPYFKAVLKAYFRQYRRCAARLTLDGVASAVENLLSLMVVKQPYYGYGMKVVPAACFDDRRLHILWLNGGFLQAAIAAVTAFMGGNRVGSYARGQRLAVKIKPPLALQIDGNPAWSSAEFAFKVLPQALKIKC